MRLEQAAMETLREFLVRSIHAYHEQTERFPLTICGRCLQPLYFDARHDKVRCDCGKDEA